MEIQVARNLAIRDELRKAMKDAGLKQKVVAELIGEREDTFSKRLSMKPGYEVLDASDMLAILDASNVTLEEFGRRLAARTRAYQRGGPAARAPQRRGRQKGTPDPSA